MKRERQLLKSLSNQIVAAAGVAPPTAAQKHEPPQFSGTGALVKLPNWIARACALGFIMIPLSTAAQASFVSYYVGIDDLPTIASGTYAGLPNPNHNRLTLLYGHPNVEAPSASHYHSKAIKTYTGPNLGAATSVVTSASDYVPEGSNPPVRLSSGTGIYAGKLVSSPYVDPGESSYPFSFFQMKSTQSLNGFAVGTAETYLFRSSSGRWDSPFDAADLHLELVSLTPGLKVGSETALNVGLNNPGDELHLGTPDANLSFTPAFYTAADAALGIYEAKFKFTDEEGLYGESGEFRVLLQVVPEPGAIGVMVVGGMLALARRRERHVAATAAQTP